MHALRTTIVVPLASSYTFGGGGGGREGLFTRFPYCGWGELLAHRELVHLVLLSSQENDIFVEIESK